MVKVFVLFQHLRVVSILKPRIAGKLVVGLIKLAEFFQHLVFSQCRVVGPTYMVQHGKTEPWAHDIAGYEVVMVSDNDVNGDTRFAAMLG